MNIYTTQLYEVILPAEGMDHLFIVMEYLPFDFNSAMNKMQLSEDHVIVLIYNCLSALRFIHGSNVLHRDIKPANILVNGQCEVRIADFGLARVVKTHDPEFERFQEEELAERRPGYRERLTLYRHVNRPRNISCAVYTRCYRPPEVIMLHKGYGKAADIWAIGLLLAEMIYSSDVYKGNDKV
jgi:mitogen-activated protein kinase 1/3